MLLEMYLWGLVGMLFGTCLVVFNVLVALWRKWHVDSHSDERATTRSVWDDAGGRIFRRGRA
jgi:predicted PurR-regulated permease PerM